MQATPLPLASLLAEQRELGLVVAVLLGFAFGFVLERAGFGRANKLAAQFYLHDMTVFKVMFSAIVTAMLGVLVASGVGLVELRALSESAASETFLFPMIVGGLLLGAGFIISGYCPGTSLVAAASGNLDGVVTVAGVIGGTLLFNEAYPLFAKLDTSGALGHLFLYDWLGIPPALLGAGVAAMALAAFVGAEKLERIFSARRAAAAPEAAREAMRPPRRLAFAAMGGLAAVALVTLALPSRPRAAAPKQVIPLSAETLARRVIEEPWTLRVLDLRARDACVKARVPGSECAPAATLAKLGLKDDTSGRELVLVGSGAAAPPAEALAFPGRVLALEGGFDAWRRYLLDKPAPPAAGAGARELEAYKVRAALHTALTGLKAAPPPAAGGGVVAPRKKKGGGCSS